MLYMKASVVSLEKFSPYYAVLTLHEPLIAEQSKPGQFVMLTPYRVKDRNSSLFLKRPLSIFSVNKEQGTICFYFQLVGKGSLFFSSLNPGDEIFILGPLGRGFKTHWTNKNLLFIGAGVGIAPFRYLYEVLYPSNPSIHVLFGGRDADAVKIRTEFPIPEDYLTIITGDGSVGKMGNIVEIGREFLFNPQSHWDYIYICGPSIVLHKLSFIALKNSIPGQVSLEAYLGCGVRACQACSFETKQGPQKICNHGPVFDIQNLMIEGA